MELNLENIYPGQCSKKAVTLKAKVSCALLKHQDFMFCLNIFNIPDFNQTNPKIVFLHVVCNSLTNKIVKLIRK